MAQLWYYKLNVFEYVYVKDTQILCVSICTYLYTHTLALGSGFGQKKFQNFKMVINEYDQDNNNEMFLHVSGKTIAIGKVLKLVAERD